MTKAEREARARRKLVRQKAEQAAYERGDCVECFKPHSNINPATRRPTRVCARCQGKRTVRQRGRREAQRRVAEEVQTLANFVQSLGRTVLGR